MFRQSIGESVSEKQMAIAGAAAAGLLELDGFRGRSWPVVMAAKHGARSMPGVFRTRRWFTPVDVCGLVVAHPSIVLRTLGLQADVMCAVNDGIAPIDRVELALEHAIRDKMVAPDQLRSGGGDSPGDLLLGRLLDRRGNEPPTESFGETRAVQRFREWGIQCWRQVLVIENGRILHRVDFVIPFRRCARRPVLLTPDDGLLYELDGREFHEGRFEEDRRRQNTYDRLGFHWMSVTPTRMEREPDQVRASID
jgi:hypothetical protein